MNRQERDILEEMFHAKLYDHEADTTPGDWEAIMNRLPESKPVVYTFRRRWLYIAAAAVTALVMTTSIFYITDGQETEPMLAQETTPVTPKPEIPIPDNTGTATVETPLVADQVETQPQSTGNPSIQRVRTALTTRQELTQETAATPVIEDITGLVETTSDSIEKDVPREDETEDIIRTITPPTGTTTFIADAQPAISSQPNTKTRRWGFGMGGGGLTNSATNTFNSLVLPSASYQLDDDMMFMNAPLKSVDYQTTLKHRTPVNVGLSASYYLNNRWSIQAGLSYSLLISESEQNTVHRHNEEQRLHFIGIPVSIAYKIAEWNKFQVYGSAGFMPEINVSGKFKTDEWIDDILKSSTTESIRMRELYWSVNARAGVSYPVIRFVNAFAEVGAGYYFDNNSEIKTIHSEKPFNVSFNFGLRFGF